MKRRAQEVINFWFTRLINLEQTKSVHNVQSLVENERPLLGLTPQDYVEEIEFALKNLSEQGYIELKREYKTSPVVFLGVNFTNTEFTYTQKFYKYKKRLLRTQKWLRLKPEILFWSAIIAAAASMFSALPILKSMVIEIFRLTQHA
jgi:hypothetical protein